MASSSPYQNVDYSALSVYKPYRLPINDIAKASLAVDEFWKVPARQIKAMHDNAVGLELSKEPNIEIRDKAVEEARKQIQKLSSMNLSDPSVQKQAFGLYKDLYSDEGVMSDHASTTHIKKVNNDALSYRQSDNGKFYSSVNHKYALTGAEEFKNSEDRMAGKEYLKQAKEYEQFYDPTTELNSIMKLCKPDKATNDIVQGFYNNTYSDESLSASKISTCLDGGLSDRAKRQLQINGAVTYKNNPEALREKYIPHLQGTRSGLSENKAAIDGILVNEKNLANLKPEQLAKLGVTDVSQITPDVIKRLKESSASMSQRISNIDNTIGKLAAGDFTPIQGEDFEPVASVVYSQDWMSNVGEGFSYNFQNNSKKADQAQLEFFRQNQINTRQEDDQQHDIAMQADEYAFKLNEQLKSSSNLKAILQGTGAEEMINSARIQNIGDHPFSSKNISDAYDEVTRKRVELTGKKDALNLGTTQEARDFGMPTTISNINSPEGRAWLNTFKIASKGDPTKEEFINRYESQMATYNALDSIFTNTQELVDNNSELKAIDTKLKTMITNIKPIKIGNIVITSSDIYNAMSGKGGPLSITEGKSGTTTFIPGAPSMGISPLVEGQSAPKYFYNGQPLPNEVLTPVVNEVRAAYGTALSTAKKKRNELMQSETVLQREGYLFPNLNDDKSEIKLRIQQETGAPLNKINIGQTDLDGKLIVTIAPPSKNDVTYDHELALKKLLDYGATSNIKLENDPNSVMLVGISDLDLINSSGEKLSEILPAQVSLLERKTSISQGQSTGYIPSIDGRQYRISVSANSTGGFIYKIIDKENPTTPVASFTNKINALQTFETRITKRGLVTINK